MKLAIIGATGKTGQAVLRVAQQRHLDVMAIVRNAAHLTVDVPTIEKDLFELTAANLVPFDVVLCTFASGKKSDYPRVNQHLVDLLTGTTTRLIVVGSGATLFADERRTKTVGNQLPIIMRYSSREHLKARQILQDSRINWTYMAPPMNYLPAGAATGNYQLGHDVLLYDQQGNSSISYADMAIALVDEMEHPQYERQLMTVAWV
ncbi:NAD(P)-dependent oxidoreductase [Levilactobacillus spicheri]|uniref:NAD(P)-binding domain-containing protein n=1 Tax=Levilactobacillus spicheri TaxID=216463 RepID=A0A0F3RTL0_9LACO|nr:NAD(P)H-binding protein [Levilactobacillus spicheri]KJW13306.1 hypothetical protein VC81_02220 [Levilactobacillus spicheri]